MTPIERWLEIELGGTAIRSTSTELSVDLLFKKPWSIFRRVEFMAGAGPQLVHDETGAHAGWSAVGDLMVWPTRHVGWYVEPGYEAVFFPGGARRGFTIAVGLLLGH